MKLSKLSQRLLAPIAASFTLITLPTFAKSDLYQKSYALGVHAASHCMADLGYIGKYEVNEVTKNALYQEGYGKMFSWLNTSNGKKAVSITRGYLNSDCTMSKQNTLSAIKKVYKYF